MTCNLHHHFIWNHVLVSLGLLQFLLWWKDMNMWRYWIDKWQIHKCRLCWLKYIGLKNIHLKKKTRSKHLSVCVCVWQWCYLTKSPNTKMKDKDSALFSTSFTLKNSEKRAWDIEYLSLCKLFTQVFARGWTWTQAAGEKQTDSISYFVSHLSGLHNSWLLFTFNLRSWSWSWSLVWKLAKPPSSLLSQCVLWIVLHLTPWVIMMKSVACGDFHR